MKNNLATEKIIRILNSNSLEKNQEITDILINNLVDKKIEIYSKIQFCNCGFPLYVEENEKFEKISEIIQQEVDFRSYREFFYCPNCNLQIDEIQH